MPSLVHHPSRLSAAAVLLPALAAAMLGIVLAPTAHAATAVTKTHDVSVCRTAGRARAHCYAIRVDRIRAGRVAHVSGPTGLTPSDLATAYSLPVTTAGSGQTVAIVDAYDDPDAASDLAVYRSAFGLPACTAADGCFRKVDQSGGTDYPTPDAGWSGEISLDLDMVSASCPRCHILLVEADSAAQSNLGAAEDEAVALGANAVSNSYGGADASDDDDGRFYHHPGVAITASAGDDGYAVSYPASSKWVTAVGGTSLSPSTRSGRGWTETAWSGTGSGCSTENSTNWQAASVTGCQGRAMNDVAAVADPATGVSVYDSVSDGGASGWLVFGGTSAAAPIIAGVYALAGNESSLTDGGYAWRHHAAGSFNDVTSGADGDCSTTRWCTARSGWDGPTGWGTPHGTSGF